MSTIIKKIYQHKYYLISVFAVFTIIFFIINFPSPSDRTVHIIDRDSLISQSKPNYCFPAVVEMITKHFNNRILQCMAYHNAYGGNCCVYPASCNGETSNRMLCKNNIIYSSTNSVLSWPDMKNKLDDTTSRHPIIFKYKPRYLSDSGRLHVVIINGYAIINGDTYLMIKDPLPVNKGSLYFINYEDYAGSGLLQNRQTFYNLNYMVHECVN